MPPGQRAKLIREEIRGKRVIYDKGVLTYLADVGAKIPVGPRTSF